MRQLKTAVLPANKCNTKKCSDCYTIGRVEEDPSSCASVLSKGCKEESEVLQWQKLVY